VGLTGKAFTVKHEDRVTEMKRAFLDYMKSLRVQAPEAINPVPPKKANCVGDPEPEAGSALIITLTNIGYPILPASIMDEELSKSVCESLMREYISQHYCRFIT
jgi:hypothetical protein